MIALCIKLKKQEFQFFLENLYIKHKKYFSFILKIIKYEKDYFFQFVSIEKSRCIYPTMILKRLDIKHS